jgi:hypothetical protein
MSETSFSVKSNGVGRVRLEPTDVTGLGSPANPQLVLGLKFQLLPHPQTQYTLLRVNAKIFVGNENHPVATGEHPPLVEDAYPNVYDRAVNLSVPLTLAQIKHIAGRSQRSEPAPENHLVGSGRIRPDERIRATTRHELAGLP